MLSSHSALRSEVVPTPRVDPTTHAPPLAPGDQLELLINDVAKKPGTPKRWAWLLKHVCSADLDVCPRCGGAMRWSDAATSSEDIQRLMAEHGLMPRPPDHQHLRLGNWRSGFVSSETLARMLTVRGGGRSQPANQRLGQLDLGCV